MSLNNNLFRITSTSIFLLVLVGLVGCSNSASKSERPVKTTSLSSSDLQIMNRAVQTTLETSLSKNTVNWNNPKTGFRGTVMPIRTMKAPNGQYCRDYLVTFGTGASFRKQAKNACRNKVGVWEVLPKKQARS